MGKNKTKKARKQRSRSANAPNHLQHKAMTVHLDDKLIEKYKFVISRIPIKKGDKVKVIRGGFRDLNKELEVQSVIVKDGTIILDGATVAKTDGKMVPRVFKPSNLKLVKLNLGDRLRRDRIERLGIELEDEDLEEEEEEEEEDEDDDDEEDDEEEDG